MHAMTRFGLPWESITHQFISHFHLDHCGELPGLLWCYRFGRRAPRTTPLEILGPVGLRALVEQTSALHGANLFDQDFPVTIHELKPGESVALGDDIVLSVGKTLHTAESLAVRVESGGQSIGYTGDAMWTDDLPRFFGGVDVLVAECSWIELPPGSRHLSLADNARLGREAGAGRLVPTHCYFDPREEHLAERLAAAGYGGAITVADDGLTLD
jgi:ribonuclease BN (tRNA processing enzyme)